MHSHLLNLLQFHCTSNSFWKKNATTRQFLTFFKHVPVTSPSAVGVYVVLFILSAKNTYTKMKKKPMEKTRKWKSENPFSPHYATHTPDGQAVRWFISLQIFSSWWFFTNHNQPIWKIPRIGVNIQNTSNQHPVLKASQHKLLNKIPTNKKMWWDHLSVDGHNSEKNSPSKILSCLSTAYINAFWMKLSMSGIPSLAMAERCRVVFLQRFLVATAVIASRCFECSYPCLEVERHSA